MKKVKKECLEIIEFLKVFRGLADETSRIQAVADRIDSLWVTQEIDIPAKNYYRYSEMILNVAAPTHYGKKVSRSGVTFDALVRVTNKVDSKREDWRAYEVNYVAEYLSQILRGETYSPEEGAREMVEITGLYLK